LHYDLVDGLYTHFTLSTRALNTR